MGYFRGPKILYSHIIFFFPLCTQYFDMISRVMSPVTFLCQSSLQDPGLLEPWSLFLEDLYASNH